MVWCTGLHGYVLPLLQLCGLTGVLRLAASKAVDGDDSDRIPAMQVVHAETFDLATAEGRTRFSEVWLDVHTWVWLGVCDETVVALCVCA